MSIRNTWISIFSVLSVHHMLFLQIFVFIPCKLTYNYAKRQSHKKEREQVALIFCYFYSSCKIAGLFLVFFVKLNRKHCIVYTQHTSTKSFFYYDTSKITTIQIVCLQIFIYILLILFNIYYIILPKLLSASQVANRKTTCIHVTSWTIWIV